MSPATATASGIRPRPVLCVIDHDHRDLALAEAVCAGRFTCAGVTRELGLPPDWLGAELPADEEWRIEWTKFYYGLDLAHAYSIAGEPRFLRAWERLLSSWVRDVPAGVDTADVAARRLTNWIYAWRRFCEAPAFRALDPTAESALLAGLEREVAHVRENLTPGRWRNHRTLELYALLIAALALPDPIDPGGGLAENALAELHRCLVEGTHADGVHREGSTHYHLLVLRSFVGAAENARRFGLPLPADYEQQLAQACEFALHCHRPDGPVSALSDADSVAYGELLELAGALLGRPDLEWVATGGTRGEPPRNRGASFPGGGYFTQRSGWGEGATAFEDERYLIFDCGPVGEGGHGHYDLLSVEIAAGGRPLIVDPGRFTYSEQPPNLRRWFKGTAAHNTVCVDGLDQTPYRGGKPRGQVAAGTFLSRVSTPGLDLLRGRAESPCYDAVHTRTIAFVAGEYWLIEDHLEAPVEHRYDLRFHLAPGAERQTAVDEAGEGSVVRAPGLALVLDPALEIELEPGWVAPVYGERLAAPVVSASIATAAARVLTLVSPQETGVPSPRLRPRPAASGATRVEVRRFAASSETIDLIGWSDRGPGEFLREAGA